MINYINENLNPKKLKTNDCVIRAISKAEGKSWEEVYTSLMEIGLKLKRLPNDKKVYQKYLSMNGYKKLPTPKLDGKKVPLKDLDKVQNNNKIYIVHVRRHLTCVINNTLYDSWDCRDYCMGNIYLKD